MVDSIINNFDSLTSQGNGSATLGLKINSTLKKLGFKKVVIGNNYVREDILESGLTIRFNPYFEGNINHYERDGNRPSYNDFISHIRELDGNDWYNNYYSLKPGAVDGQVTLKVDLNGTKYEIGHYLPSRNMVLIYMPMGCNWDKGLDNKYILEVLGYIEKLAEEHKFKEIDISETKKKIMIEKFTRGIIQNINNCDDNINSAERNKKDYQKSIIKQYGIIKEEVVKKGSLIIYLKQIQGGLDGKIEEIKKLKFVKSVTTTDEGIELKFDKISIKVKDKNIKMGNFTVTLMPEKIKIVNDEPIKRGGSIYHSCHIQGDNICFGQQSTMAMKLLGELELKKLVHFLWLYLNSYNEGDTYIPMRDWILGRENGNIVPDDTDNYNDDGDYNDE